MSEDGLCYTVDNNYFSFPSVGSIESNSMQIEQGDVNNNIETSSSSSPSKVQSKSIKKRQRYTVEFKKKILHMLETKSQSEVQALVNIDRRVIGKWTKVENKKKSRIV